VEAESNGEDPVDILGAYNVLEFDEHAKEYEMHPETNEEIKLCCADLKVLGKKDFRNLLKWRKIVWKDKQKKEKETKQKENQEINKTKEEKIDEQIVQVKKLTFEDEEKLVDEQLQKRMLEIDSVKKKKKKKEKKRRKKAKKRQEFGLAGMPSIEFEQTDEDLFNLGEIKGKGAIAEIKNVSVEQGIAQHQDDEEEEEEEEEEEDEGEGYKETVEDFLDRMYDAYVQRRGINVDGLRRKQEKELLKHKKK